MNKTENDLKKEINQLSKELRERIQNRRKNTFRMRIWFFTVRMSYLIKRVFDLLFSLIALILLLPFLLLIALLVRLTSPGPAIFTQIRVGRFGRHFKFYKFRTMYQGASLKKQALQRNNQSADGVIFKMKNDPRITPLGKFLRRTSIDELPQLVNVMMGDMSLVGPRPPLPAEVRQYTIEDWKRLHVIPGLTCLWQISGRSDIPFSQQVKLDKEYIQSRSTGKDLWILLKTIPAILFGKGAY